MREEGTILQILAGSEPVNWARSGNDLFALLADRFNVLAKALVSGATLDASDLDVILAEKEQIIRKSGILECYSSPERLGDVGGLVELKQWLDDRRAAFSQKARDFALPYPRGIIRRLWLSAAA